MNPFGELPGNDVVATSYIFYLLSGLIYSSGLRSMIDTVKLWSEMMWVKLWSEKMWDETNWQLF